MNKKFFEVGQLAVIVAAVFCIGWQASFIYGSLDIDENESERNESSTPRSLILPPTPAIAELYEKFDQEAVHPGHERACLFRLRDLGYPIDELQTAFNAKFVEALVRFQKRQALNVTGRLDAQTMERLRCG